MTFGSDQVRGLPSAITRRNPRRSRGRGTAATSLCSISVPPCLVMQTAEAPALVRRRMDFASSSTRRIRTREGSRAARAPARGDSSRPLETLRSPAKSRRLERHVEMPTTLRSIAFADALTHSPAAGRARLDQRHHHVAMIGKCGTGVCSGRCRRCRVDDVPWRPQAGESSPVNTMPASVRMILV